MKRIVGGLGRLAMVVALFGAASVSATTYYIAANGSLAPCAGDDGLLGHMRFDHA